MYVSECSAHVVCQVGFVQARNGAVTIAVESRGLGLRDNLGGCRDRDGR